MTSPDSPISTPAASASIWSPLGLRPAATSSTSPSITVLAGRRRHVQPARPRAVMYDPFDMRPEHQVEPVGGELGVALRDVVILGTEQSVAAVDDRDLRAERPEDVAELGGDEPPTEHDEVLGQMGDVHDRVAGVKRHLVDAGNLRYERPRAGGDHHPLAADLLSVDDQRSLADEAGRCPRTPSRSGGEPILAPTFGDRIDPAEHAFTIAGQSADSNRGRHPVLGSVVLGRRLGDVGCVDQHLRWDAATVQACAAEGPPLDDGDSPTVHLVVDHRVSRPRADDDQVILFRRHSVSLACSLATALARDRESDTPSAPTPF